MPERWRHKQQRFCGAWQRVGQALIDRLGTGTGIDGTFADEKESSYIRTGVYDLQGRRVKGTPAAGLYIINGKKTIVK